MQTAEAIDLVLVLPANFVTLASSSFVFFCKLKSILVMLLGSEFLFLVLPYGAAYCFPSL